MGTLEGLPAYAYGWQRGGALELIAVFGRRVTLARLVALARIQDARLPRAQPTKGPVPGTGRRCQAPVTAYLRCESA